MIEELNKELTILLSDPKLTWDKCQRIACLYNAIQAIQHYGDAVALTAGESAEKQPTKAVSDELKDIIPCLSEYLKTKQDFREGKTTEQAVIHQAERLAVEINEFITALNAHATETERGIFARIK